MVNKINGFDSTIHLNKIDKRKNKGINETTGIILLFVGLLSLLYFIWLLDNYING